MAELIRILHRVGSLGNAGLEAVVMNYYRHIDRNKVQFDFIAEGTEKQRYDDEIEALGGKVYRIPVSRLFHPVKYLKYLSEILKNGNYKVFHLHTNSASIVMEAKLAKKYKIPNIIGHSHNASCKLKLQHYLFKPFLNGLLTDRFACSRLAAKWLYGDKVTATVCNNAIDTDKFTFRPEVRERLRKEFGVSDNFVVGHVGRFEHQKNHEFLTDVFSAFRKECDKAVLFLIGDGMLKESIMKKVEELGISESVRFLGNRNDVADLYQLFDVFVLPSRFEGLPVVLVEAQACGVPCIASDKITDETKITDFTEFLDIDNGVEVWKNKLLEEASSERKRCDVTEIIKKNGYDISKQAQWLQEYYINLHK